MPSSRIFTIRPYVPGDEEQVYNVCTKTCKDGLEDPSPLVPELKNIHADRIVGPYLTLHPEFCFVVEVILPVFFSKELFEQKLCFRTKLVWLDTLVQRLTIENSEPNKKSLGYQRCVKNILKILLKMPIKQFKLVEWLLSFAYNY